jgi:release factor glutamine methyltransferase
MKEIEFYHSRLLFDPQKCLVPRVETELLVEKIALFHKNNPPGSFADICCGCGTIGIPLSLVFKTSKPYFSDLSLDALEILKKNLALNEVQACVLHGDLLDPFIDKGIKVDLLVCNPPYVALDEVDFMDDEALKEPKMALFGGEDGLDFYRRLALDLPRVLKQKAFVYFEIGFRQGPKLLEIFSAPFYHHLKVEKDYSGHDRFFSLVFQSEPLIES